MGSSVGLVISVAEKERQFLGTFPKQYSQVYKEDTDHSIDSLIMA